MRSFCRAKRLQKCQITQIDRIDRIDIVISKIQNGPYREHSNGKRGREASFSKSFEIANSDFCTKVGRSLVLPLCIINVIVAYVMPLWSDDRCVLEAKKA